MTDLTNLEREILLETLQESVRIDMNVGSIFEYRKEITSGFINDLDEFSTLVHQSPISESESKRFLRDLENVEESY